MKRFLLGILFSLCGVLLIPLCVATSWAVGSLVASIRPESFLSVPAAAWALALGFIVWMAVYFTLPRPVRTYVLAHELTHALWAALTGAKVRGITVSKNSGSVMVSGNNILITLAPYFFPLYTVIVIAVYYLLSIFLDMSQYMWVWLFLIGLTWGFHVSFTLGALSEHQSDLDEYGVLLSVAIIWLFNILGIGVWIVMVTPATIVQFAMLLASDIVAVWAWILQLFVGS